MGEAKNFSRVKVESLLSVVSSKPTEPGKVHNFSLLDRSMGLHTLHAIFYYESNPFNDGPMNSDLDNLRVSLSHVLDQYTIVTGRLTRDPDGNGWIVKCNDAGVRMLQARVSVEMDEWLRSADAVEERDLTVWEDMPLDPSFWSPFRIQINSFKCGGLAIGVSCTHMHADITSVTMFIKSWTEVHRGQPLTHPPTFNLPSPPPSFNTSSTPSFFPPKESNTTRSKMATITMRFSSLSIQKLVYQVQNQCPKATPFDVLVALFWSRVASFQDSTPNRNELSICVDMRNMENSCIPLDYFGNALHFSSISQDHDKLLNGGLGTLAEYVHRHVAGIKGDEFWAVMHQLESLGKEGNEAHRMYGPRLTCVDLEHMADAENGIALMYTATFKKGERPALVSYNIGNVEGQGLIIVMPSAEPGMARNVLVTLPEEQIANLCKDQMILDLEPVVIIGGKK